LNILLLQLLRIIQATIIKLIKELDRLLPHSSCWPCACNLSGIWSKVVVVALSSGTSEVVKWLAEFREADRTPWLIVVLKVGGHHLVHSINVHWFTWL